MKKVILKLFCAFCSIVFMCQGALLFMVRFENYMMFDVTALLQGLYASQRNMDILFISGVVFLHLGFVFFLISLKKERVVKTVVVSDKGEAIRIPVDTIREYVKQLLARDTDMFDINTTIEKKGKYLYVTIACEFLDVMPVRHKIQEVKTMIKTQLASMFDLPFLKVEFKIDGVRVGQAEVSNDSQMLDVYDHAKETAMGEVEQDASNADDEQVLCSQAVMVSGADNDLLLRDSIARKSSQNKMPWEM